MNNKKGPWFPGASIILIKLRFLLHLSILVSHKRSASHLTIAWLLASVSFSFERHDNSALLNLLVETSNQTFWRLFWIFEDGNSHKFIMIKAGSV